jgi:hypothetical protein
MTKFMLSIELDNDAMQTGDEVAEVLSKVARQVDGLEYFVPGLYGNLRDENGNLVGSWQVSS